MANMSPATELAALTPRVFRFPSRRVLNYEIVFYSDALGTVKLETAAGGSVDLDFEVKYDGSGLVGSDPDDQPIELPFASVEPNGTVLAVPGATVRGFGLGSGACCVRMTPTAVVPAAGAVSYRLHVPDTKVVS